MSTTTLIPAATPPSRQPSRTTKALLLCGAAAGPLFTLAFLIEGASRDGYDPLRHPVSSLAIGAYGWTQTANFLLCGLLTLAFAVGVRRALRPGRAATWGPLLIGVWAIGLLGAGAFVADPVSGYPPGTPDTLPQYTTSGALHDGFALFAFPALVAACFVFTRRFAGQRQHGWAIYSALTGLAFLAGDILAGAGFSQTAGLVDLAGLYQRITVIIGLLWLTLLAMHLRSQVSKATHRRATR
ncbi:DUF998 domain-containing protein [Micromonospora sp. WMMD1155]|uniref:DUF998 domain-containing protein n=1 Tax=Micromonospora sp. WMMD1155 TaxID=3016094 RepID=UPI00249BA9D7|nr:DUF998 domain-containing protein [Micromonospora sp. WMMD1155]WFE49178.1 DUF998 domain-containing protein [Micromonospora sp. WMMD1155]